MDVKFGEKIGDPKPWQKVIADHSNAPHQFGFTIVLARICWESLLNGTHKVIYYTCTCVATISLIF